MTETRRPSAFALVLTWIALALAGEASGALPPVEITACGQSVALSPAVLIADLDCSAFPGTDLTLEHATLDLAGFTLIGSVLCRESCTVTSKVPGGSLVGGVRVVDTNFDDSASLGIRAATLTGLIRSDGSISCEDSEIVGNLDALKAVNVRRSNIQGSVRGEGSVTVIDSSARSISGLNFLNGARGRIVVRRSQVQTGGVGGVAVSIRVIDSQILSTNDAVHVVAAGLNCSISVVGSHITASAGAGISLSGRGSVRLSQSVVENSRSGIVSTGSPAEMRRVSLVRSSVIGNALDGVRVDGQLQAQASNVLGNGLDAQCGVTVECADLNSSTRPSIRVIPGLYECGTSHVLGSGIPGASWGVCLGD
jgi:hypothetical protein